MSNNEFISILKDKNPIDQVIEELLGDELNYPGYGAWATYDKCPSCGSSDGFRVNLDSQTFICFSSKEQQRFWGDVIDYVMFARKYSFQEALEYLAKRAGIELPILSEEENAERQKQKTVNGILTYTADYYAGKLTAKVTDYLTGRGFTEETIKERRIGYAPGDHGLFRYLPEKGFTREEISLSGVADGGRDYFAAPSDSGIEGFITFPNLDGGLVLDIQGRAFPGGKPKYKNLPGALRRPYNFRAASAPEVIIAEGIPDAISAIQMGHAAVGIYGVNGFRAEWVELFSRARQIFVCMDSDDAGNKKAIEIARLFGKRARIVQLQGVKDVNELLQKRGDQAKDVFKDFLQQAKSPYQVLIDRLPENPLERLEPINEIMELLAEMEPLDCMYYLGALKVKTGITKKDLQEQLNTITKRLQKAAKSVSHQNVGEPELLEDPTFIKLGLDIANGILIMSQNFHLKLRTANGVDYETWEPKLITSDRRLIPIPKRKGISDKELVTLKLGESDKPLAVRAEVNDAENRWSKFGFYSISAFLKGEAPSIDMAALYQEILACIHKWFYSESEEDYIICALYIIMTYFIELFMAVPYIHINGMPGSGKSTLARVFEILTFNGMLLIEPSDASFFRMAETMQLTAIVDEKENIGSRYAAQANPLLMSFLKSRYQRNAFVTRQDTNNVGTTVKFETFGATVLCNVHGLEDILSQRAIPVLTQEVPKDKQNLIVGKQPRINDEFRQIRDRLYCAAMEHYLKIRELAEQDTRGTTNARDNEMFHPLLVLADFIDSFSPEVQVKAKLEVAITSKLELRQMDKEKAPEAQLKEALIELLVQNRENKPGGSHAFHAIQIIDKINELAGVSQDFAKVNWVANKLKSLKIIRNNGDKIRRPAQIVPRNSSNMQPIPNVSAEAMKVYHYNIRYDRIVQ